MDIVLQLGKDYEPGHHHLASFDMWRRNGLREVLEGHVFESESYKWVIENVCVVGHPSQADVKKALENGGCVSCEVYVDIVQTHKPSQTVERLNKLHIATIPAIVADGHAVINGLERSIITQIRNAYNCLTVLLSDQNPRRNHTRSYSLNTPHILAHCSLRSMSSITHHSCTCEISLWSSEQYTLRHGKLKGKIDVLLLLRGLGLVELDDYRECFGIGNTKLAERLYTLGIVYPGVEEAQEALSKELKFAQKTATQPLDPLSIQDLLVRELFPHLGPGASREQVTSYLGYMISNIFQAANGGPIYSRDSLHSKRLEAAGVLVGDLTRQLVKKWLESLETNCRNRDHMVAGLVEAPLSKRLLYCFSTGVWGSQMTSYKRTGVSQPLTTGSWLARRSHIQRIASPVSRETRNQNIRQFHTSQIGYICPFETPEGHAVGVVLNLACTASITVKFPTSLLLHFLEPYLAKIDSGLVNGYLVIVNGVPVGRVPDAWAFYLEFSKMRIAGFFGAAKEWGKVSIGFQGQYVCIWADEGRPVRLVRTGQATKPFDNWFEGIKLGALRWVDPYEEEFGFEKILAENELHPVTWLGVSAASIPLINFGPAPRGVYATNMIKQAVAATYEQATIGAVQSVGLGMCNPLVTTRLAPPKPFGYSVIVAICPFYGFNQEDAVVVSRASIERGMFSSLTFRTWKVYEETTGEVFKTIGLPSATSRNTRHNYSMLDENGLIRPNSRVVAGDVLVGSTSFSKQDEEDTSEVYNRSEPAIVYKSTLSGQAPFRIATITLVENMTLNVGDKIASRHAQKHTVGYIAELHELPFTEDGLVPDIIMNPLALPSRATPTVLEAAVSLKVLGEPALFPYFCDAFCERPEGLKDGLQTTYNPVSSTLMNPIFMGPVYYMRLPHFSKNKCYARARGVVSKQTRQPTDGRSRHGGLRVGEMERDAILALRMPHVLEDRFFYNSDIFWVNVCQQCGSVAINKNICYCGNVVSSQIEKVKLSFSSNLIINQMKALGCSVKMGLGKPPADSLWSRESCQPEEDSSDMSE